MEKEIQNVIIKRVKCEKFDDIQNVRIKRVKCEKFDGYEFDIFALIDGKRMKQEKNIGMDDVKDVFREMKTKNILGSDIEWNEFSNELIEKIFDYIIEVKCDLASSDELTQLKNKESNGLQAFIFDNEPKNELSTISFLYDLKK